MEKNVIPTTTRQAFNIIDAMLTATDIECFCNMTTSEFIHDQHWGLGLWIRNNWIYESDEEDGCEKEARDKCYCMLAGKLIRGYLFPQPDDVSANFLERYHRHLKRKR